LIEETKSKLYRMKLNGMAEGLDSQMRTPHCLSLPFEERIGMLVDHEQTYRENRRLQTLLRSAKLKFPAQIESIRYEPSRNLDRDTISNLAACGWVDKGFNVLFTSATGTGKTHLACALGYQACLKGKTVQFFKVGLILDDLEQAKTDGTLRKRLIQVNRAALLILDDLGIKARLSSTECELLLELLDGRHGVGATIITSQLPLTSWHEYLSASYPTTADAILDRICTNAVKIELLGVPASA
jgi:DNA replication protein DnaC